MNDVLLWHWVAFCSFVGLMLFLDLAVFNRQSHETSMREAAGWTLFWCSLAVVFNLMLWWWQGPAAAGEFLAGYLVEWSLSMDNVFVFALIFSFFRVPRIYQHRVLFWGILGAVFMRLTFILVGNELIKQFDWILPLLGLVLIYSGIKMAFHGEADVDPEKNIVLRIARRLMPVAVGDHGSKFLVREAGRLCVTPLFLVLLVVESTDVVFAVDSVPAIFGLVSKNAPYFTFVVFTSNVFAILGLRALYFLLAGAIGMFRYLGVGLAAILVFVGVKMGADFASHKLHWIEEGEHLIPFWVSLAVIIGVLAVAVIASIIVARREEERRLDEAALGKSNDDAHN